MSAEAVACRAPELLLQTADMVSVPVRVQQGQLYNAEDGRKALRDVFALGLFDNVQIFPKPNQKDESKVCIPSAPYVSAHISLQKSPATTGKRRRCWLPGFAFNSSTQHPGGLGNRVNRTCMHVRWWAGKGQA